MTSSSATRGQMWFGSALSRDHRLLPVPNAPGTGQGILAECARRNDGSRCRASTLRRCLVARSARTARSSRPAATTGGAAVGRQDGGARGDLVGQDGRVLPATFSRDHGQLTMRTVGLDGTMITWDVSGSRRLGQPFHAGAGFDGDSDRGARRPKSSSARMDACWQRMTPSGSRSSTRPHTPSSARSRHAADGSFDAAWSPDGTRLAVTGTGTEMVELYDTATWRPIARTVEPLQGPSADRAAYARRDRPDHPLVPQRLNIARAIAFSPDSKELVAGRDDGALWTWDARTGAPAGPPPPAPWSILDVAFNPVRARSRSRYVDYGCQRGVAPCTHRGAQTPLYTVNVDDGSGLPEAVAFSPDGEVLATGGGEGRHPLLGRGHRVGARHASSRRGGLGPRPCVDAVGHDARQLGRPTGPCG